MDMMIVHPKRTLEHASIYIRRLYREGNLEYTVYRDCVLNLFHAGLDVKGLL